MDKSRRRETVSQSDLERWRALRSVDVALAVASYAKADATYAPVGNAGSQRWHLELGEAVYELLLTGPKFWDIRANCGGGGAIDLVVHLLGCDFKRAVAVLREHGL